MDNDNFLDTSSTKKQKALSKAEERRRKQELEDLRKIISIPEGRRYLWRKLGEAGCFRTPFTLNSASTAFNCGSHNFGLRLLDEINAADAYAFSKMQQEHFSALNSKPKEEISDDD